MTRTLAGLPFRVLSPSLYACLLDRGTLALRYNGEQWEIVTLSCDEPEQITLAGTFKQAVQTLWQATIKLGVAK